MTRNSARAEMNEPGLTWSPVILPTAGQRQTGACARRQRTCHGNWVPPGWLSPDETRTLLTGRLTKVCDWARYRRSQAAEASTRLLLDTVCAGMEAQLASLAALTA